MSTRLRRTAALGGRIVLFFLVPLLAVLAGLYVYARGGRFVDTENAYVKANIIEISTAIPGRVIEVMVTDNQVVAKATPLFRLDPAPYEIAVARAEAELDVVRTELRSLRAEHRVAASEATETTEQIDFLKLQMERQERLKERGMGRADQYDEARHNLQAAKRKLASALEKANQVRAELAGDAQVDIETHPRFLEAKAKLDAAAHELTRTRLFAPADGVVSNMKLQVGEFVERGRPLFSVIDSGPVWIEANFKETQLTYLREGQPARVVADAYPHVSWPATVKAIAPATGAEFAVLPPQNASGNWVKVVQRIPVNIEVELRPDFPKLRAGMTVSVEVDTGRERGLPRPVQQLVKRGVLPDFLQPSPALANARP
jgi:membrane fusion protein (multidrug efflux system)